MTGQNRPVMVNGNSVPSGTTIFSGAQIRTPAETGATVDLGPLGRLDLGPNTTASLTFSEGSVTVNLQSGYALLTTKKGVKGSVINPQGAVTSTDPTKVSSVVVTVGTQGPNAAGSSAAIAAAGPSTGETLGMMGAAAAALTTGGVASSNGRGRGRNLSPGVPRGPR